MRCVIVKTMTPLSLQVLSKLFELGRLLGARPEPAYALAAAVKRAQRAERAERAGRDPSGASGANGGDSSGDEDGGSKSGGESGGERENGGVGGAGPALFSRAPRVHLSGDERRLILAVRRSGGLCRARACSSHAKTQSRAHAKAPAGAAGSGSADVDGADVDGSGASGASCDDLRALLTPRVVLEACVASVAHLREAHDVPPPPPPPKGAPKGTPPHAPLPLPLPAAVHWAELAAWLGDVRVRLLQRELCG